MRDDYLQYHMDTNPDQPFYIPEFQAGSYDPYAGPGYEACARMTNASFTRVANQALIAQRVTLLSLYMVYGGTNWGGLAEPDVYSSYDYGAALNEHRQPNDKYAELKRQAGFIAAFPDLAMTEQIADKPGLNISQVGDLDDEDASVDPATIRTTVAGESKDKEQVLRGTAQRHVRVAPHALCAPYRLAGQGRGDRRTTGRKRWRSALESTSSLVGTVIFFPWISSCPAAC